MITDTKQLEEITKLIFDRTYCSVSYPIGCLSKEWKFERESRISITLSQAQMERSYNTKVASSMVKEIQIRYPLMSYRLLTFNKFASTYGTWFATHLFANRNSDSITYRTRLGLNSKIACEQFINDPTSQKAIGPDSKAQSDGNRIYNKLGLVKSDSKLRG